MSSLIQTFDRVDRRITGALQRIGLPLLRMSLGIIFLWFGALKFFPGLSPAQDLATRTISELTFGMIEPSLSIYMLALLETLIGLGLLFGVALRTVLLLLLFQMIGTITPLFLFPQEVFLKIPYAPTLEGQYIIKNLILISAGFVIGSTVRDGRRQALGR